MGVKIKWHLLNSTSVEIKHLELSVRMSKFQSNLSL